MALSHAIACWCSACDAGAFVVGAEPTDMPIDISVDLAQYAVSGVSVEVTGPGIDNPIIANLPVDSGFATGQVEVLSGSDRAFTVRAYDAQSVETHRGGDTVDIAADAVQTLSMSLSPLTGDVGVDATVGSYTVSISLPADAILVGDSVQATVTVVDPAGNTVASPTVTWGSSNPSVASVTPDGLIQGLVSGQTSIGVSYEGFAADTTLVVQ